MIVEFLFSSHQAIWVAISI